MCRPIRKSWKRSLHARLRLHAGRGPGGLSERVQAVHRLSGAVHRQARGLLPGAVELGRDRGDALGPPARRGLLDRPDRLRRQPRGRGSVRGQGHREGTAGLPSDRRSSRRTAPTRSSPISRASASRTHRRRRIPAISRRSCCYPPEGLKPERGLQAADVGRARQVGARRRVRRLRHGRRRFRRLRAHGHARHDQGATTSASSTRARSSRPRPSPMRTTSSRISPRRSATASSPSASRRRCARNSTATTASSRSPTRTLESGARDRGRIRHAVQQGGLSRRKQSARPRRSQRSSKSRRRRSSSSLRSHAGHGRIDTAQARWRMTWTARSSSATCARNIAPASRCCKDVSLTDRGPRHDRDHRPVRAPANRR